MTKTVKELIEPNIDRETGWFNQEINYYDLLTNILETYKETIKTYADIIQKLGYEHKAEKEKIIAEKDKEIEKLKQQQLYKEDFDLTCYAECNCDGEGCGYGLIDNSKWEKLLSKEDI